jgi:uncharacterized lipoprotein YajG
MRQFIVFIIITSLFSACKKDEEKYSDVPAITFESISPGIVKQFSDSVIVTIGYEDGNGDLGENGSDVKNAFVTDSRNDLTYGFRVKQLAPTDASIIIKGKLLIIVPQVALNNLIGTAETATFSIYVKDRAGNKSNVVSTSSITITE